ncbi:MAG TPA: bifunctional phosphoribosylaminoimidazolecarboxamide formyltransferase/IMP cyclohydrolase [Gaiellaceae bacterium]|nr:bifunctional phosphoribosylaminoimidazolecarboxamide formyltransferase/IMP cyclohydrolase [Gaiellaceae bacterium]
MRALISVYDKDGLADFARGLDELGWELVASGGTSAFLEELGLPVTKVEALTESPELLGGRVKTLHPRIHAAILARPGVEDASTLAAHGIEPFDLVCVNLYPFQRVAARRGVLEEEAVEMIDVGGPSMLRGAAKNFARVSPVCRPDQYGFVLDELRAGKELSIETRRQLAAEAFATTAAYEAAIAAFFASREGFPDLLTLSFEKVTDLAYGENPHQQAAYYREAGSRRHLLSEVTQLHGKLLSLVNLYDLSAARLLLREFELPACVIVKHGNPCGAAVAATIEEAWARAYAGDPVSAFGMVLVLNRPVAGELGRALAETFIDVLFAPGYDEAALEALKAKPATRLLLDRERRRFDRGEKDYKRVVGGLLVQDRDWDTEDRELMEVRCGRVDESEWGDLLFAWRVCKHVGSNAIVLAKNLQTIGIGAGQMSRVDAVRIAVGKARELGHDLRGAVLASDAFFPFPDGPVLALEQGVRAIIQPGGSIRDDEVARAVEAAGAAMIVTGRRHFRH